MRTELSSPPRGRRTARTRLRSMIGVASVSTVVLASACGANGAAHAGGGDSSVLRIGLPAVTATLNPAKAAIGPTGLQFGLTNEPLLHLTDDGTYAPGLAVHWGYVGSGNRTFDLTLRKNARYSDGTPVTADSVATWLRYMSKAGGTYANALPLDSVESTGKYSLRISLSTPSAIVPSLLSDANYWGSVACPSAVADGSFTSSSCGAGPYTVKTSASVPGSSYTLVPNKYYYDKDKIRYKKIKIVSISSSTSRLQSLQSGQIDVAYGDYATAEAAASKGFRVTVGAGTFTGLFFPDKTGATVKALSDKRVRKALNYAVDRKAIAASFVGEYGRGTSQYLTTDDAVSSLDHAYSYNRAKAKALLREAGYADGFRLKILAPGFDGSLGAPLAQAVAKYFGAIGVKVTVDTAATMSEFVSGFATAEAVLALNVTAAPTAQQLPAIFGPHGGLNPTSWSDPKLTRLADQAASAPPSRAESYWKQINRHIVEHALTLPLLATGPLYFSGKNVAGIKQSPHRPNPVAREWSPAA